MNYQLYVTQADFLIEASKLASFTNRVTVVDNLALVDQSQVYLLFDNLGLAIVVPGTKPAYIREIYSKLPSRMRDAHKELLVEAVKSKVKGNEIHVLDLTAGLAKDAALLAFTGFRVTMLERNPLLATIIYYALLKGYLPSANLELVFTDSVNYLRDYPLDKKQPDVIYFDPMFKDDNIKSLAKKNMQIIQYITSTEVCDQKTSDLQIFLLAQKVTTKIVVKRDNKQELIINTLKPSYTKLGQTVRFDVYM